MKKLDLNTLRQSIENIAQYDLSKSKAFGLAYYVYQEGCLSLEKCYGKTSLDDGAPITNNTLFRLASMTKPITALAALILVERGLLSLDDTVDKFLPEFKNIFIADSSGNHIKASRMPTVRNILSHSSGIASNWERLGNMTAEDRRTIDSSVAYYIKNGLDFEPGTAQMYSPTGAFDVLVKIIEAVSETDYPSFLQKEIFAPCGMLNTTFVPTAEQEKQMVKMHQIVNGENAVFEIPSGCIFEGYPQEHYLGGAGLVSSLHDYSRFAKMLLNRGSIDGNRLISEKSFKQLCTPQISNEIMPGNERWGLGVRVISKDAYPYLPKGTFGWSGAYGSHFWVDAENKIFAVFMKNSKVDGGAANESARNFEKAVYSSFKDGI